MMDYRFHKILQKILGLYKQGMFCTRAEGSQNAPQIGGRGRGRGGLIHPGIERLVETLTVYTVHNVASWSSGRHLALGSGDPGFKSCLCQVDVESLGKALYMHFLTRLMCKNEYPTIGSILE